MLDELVALLRLDERSTLQLCRLLKRRELLGSTGVGRGIAIPHCRSLALNRLRLAFGLHRAGLEYDAVDHRPAHIFFMIVAPPTEVSNQYLPVLGKIAQLAQIPDVPDRLRAAQRHRPALPAARGKGGLGYSHSIVAGGLLLTS